MSILSKYTIWIHLQDNGDGSVSAKVFDSEADAEAYTDQAEKNGHDRHEGDIESRMLIFEQTLTGPRLVNPDEPEVY